MSDGIPRYIAPEDSISDGIPRRIGKTGTTMPPPPLVSKSYSEDPTVRVRSSR